MNAFNGKCRCSGYASSETLRPIFKKMAQLITSETPPHTQVLGSIGSKGACLHMREIVALRRLFFDLMGIATGRPVGPIVVVNGSNDAFSWQSRPFMVSLITKIFSLFFNQKCEKLHYILWRTRRAITRERLKRGFRGRAIEWCHSNLPQTDPRCHGNQS